jgi:hypothetical protein
MKKNLLLFMVAGLMVTASAHAQIPLLKGTWTFESATVVQNNSGGTTNVNVNTVKSDTQFALFDKLVFNNAQLTLILGDIILEGQAAITSGLIQSDAFPSPLIFTWKIEDGKLYLEREFTHYSPENPNTDYKVSSIYTK